MFWEEECRGRVLEIYDIAPVEIYPGQAVIWRGTSMRELRTERVIEKEIVVSCNHDFVLVWQRFSASLTVPGIR